MKSTSRLLSILLLAMMLAGVIYIQPLAMTTNDGSMAARQEDSNRFVTAAFDSQNISVSLVSPTNRSGVSGPLVITIDITSDFVTLNVTLFIEDAIYSAYNKTPIGVGNQPLSVDTTTIAEGNLNFTILLEYKDATWDEKESFFLEYFVDNDFENFEVSLTSPANESTLTGTASLLLNITSDFAFINFTLYIEGEIYPAYDGATIPSDASINYKQEFYANGTTICYTVDGSSETVMNEAQNAYLDNTDNTWRGRKTGYAFLKINANNKPERRYIVGGTSAGYVIGWSKIYEQSISGGINIKSGQSYTATL